MSQSDKGREPARLARQNVVLASPRQIAEAKVEAVRSVRVARVATALKQANSKTQLFSKK
jgi:hypothetical protein